MDGFTIDDYATLGDEAALKLHLDRRTIASLRFFAPVGLFVAFSETVGMLAEWNVAALPFVVVHLVLNALLFFAIRRTKKERLDTNSPIDQLARFVEAQARPVAEAFLLLHFLVGLLINLGSDGVIPWLMVSGYVAIFFRFVPSHRLILHGIMAAAAFVTPIIWPGDFDTGIVIGASINQAIPLAIGIWTTHRVRVKFLLEWRREREAVREQIRMREELEFARQIQLSMLPRESPELDWLDISAMSLPATEVGGDYFDYFEVGDGRFAIVSADVAGHGMASGIVLSGIRSCLTLLSEELAQPTRVMEKMQLMVRKTARHRMLVTLSILLLDRHAGTATITSAGHPPVLIRRGDGTVDEITIESLPLGAPGNGRYEATTVPFAPGDVFIVQTDGVYEALDPDHNYYGLDRLAELVAGIDEDSAQEIRDLVIRDLWTHKGAAAQEDDITLVVARVV